MSSSRVRSRLAALLGAVPLVLATGPFVSPAFAADSVREAALVDTQGTHPRIGPNAGFNGDVARGVEGRTAIVAISPAASDTLTRVQVALTESAGFAYANDFDSIDGLALYKDLDDNDRLDPADYAAGPVSQPQPAISVDGNAVIVTVETDAAKATGEDNYLLTVHPAAGATGERTAHFTIPADGVTTSAGTMPATPLAVQDITFDAQAPAPIPLSNFTSFQRIPTADCPAGAVAGTCGDDSYKLYTSTDPEADEKIGFFNNGTDFNDNALLRVPAGNSTAPAVYPAETLSNAANSPTELSIGNGTGRIASDPASRALNNQISDDVWAVLWDPIGNRVPLKLTNAPTCNPGPGCNEANPFVPRGNDVTAPNVTNSVVMSPVDAAADLTKVRVRATITSTDSAVPQFVAQTPVTLLARPQVLNQIPGSSPAAYVPRPTHETDGAEVRSATPVVPSASATVDALVDVSDVDAFPEGDFVWSATRLLDTRGNSTLNRNTAAVLKDTVKPSFVRISLIDTNGDGNADPGEQYRVAFNDAMDTSKITSGNVNTELLVTDPAQATCGPPTAPTTPCVKWGAGPTAPTVSWSDDQRLLTITLGDECPTTPNASCTSLTRLPRTGDLVTAKPEVTDRNQNALTSATSTIAQPTVVPVVASTVDSVGVGNVVWGTNRDGILDAIDVKFSGTIDAASVTEASDKDLFKVNWNGKTVPATAARTATDTVRVSFDPPAGEESQWGTGATPRVLLNNDPLTGTTHVTTTTPAQAIVAFNFSSVDRAAPVPLSVTTSDSDKNGHIDKVLVQFSEGIQHVNAADGNRRPENVCGWRVAGYTNPAYTPATGALQPSACNPASNQATQGVTNDIVSLALLASTTTFDTGATPLVSFSATAATPNYAPNATQPTCMTIAVTGATSNVDCPILDAAGNGLHSFSGNAADKAAPVIASRITEDTNSDGRIDRIKATFSETLSTPSIGDAVFQVTEPVYSIVSLSVPSANAVAINVENIPGGQGDTAVTPKLTFLGGTTDVADPPNASPGETAGVVVTDKAPPAILAACSSSPAGTNGTCPVDDAANDKVTVLFSEVLDPASVALGDFVVEQPVNTAKTATAFNVETGNTRVTLTFAQGAIAATADGVVRLANAGAVTDNAASGKNLSTQTTNVPIFPTPTVSLDLTCPTPANDGYCGANQVNTGASGIGGITAWRLSTTARGATPPDSEFTSSVSSVYPDSGVLPEGTLTLYLSGKDGFGRLSPEFSDSIQILKAPHLSDVQLADATSGPAGGWPKNLKPGVTDQTVVDGDNILIGATGAGTDAAEWATKATGGGCLGQYMSIDVHGLTGASNQTALAPVKCDLQNTVPPSRQMQFPIVKASKTTRYPVGTVLRSATSGYNYLVADGPNDTIVRRRYISVGARRSWQIPDALVITVPSTLLTGMGSGPNVGYRDGALVKSSASGYYVVSDNVKRLVSTTTLAYWHIPTSTAYAVTSTEMKAMATGTTIGQGVHASGTWIEFANGAIQQVTRNGTGTLVRRAVANSTALKTLVPSSQIFPANSKDAALPLDTWVRGYRDGTLLKVTTGYAVVSRSSLRRFADAKTFNSLGFNTSNAIGANGSAMPHVTAQPYRTGATIDRYKITTIVIKLTNKAGTTVTAIVTPTVGGIYGLGTFDPAPLGWDTSRS
jgi:hypothetical protein